MGIENLNLLASDGRPEMPNPTEEQMDSPEFQAIWSVIKSWDVNVREFYDGYMGANGSHVILIMNALKAVKNAD